MSIFLVLVVLFLRWWWLSTTTAEDAGATAAAVAGVEAEDRNCGMMDEIGGSCLFIVCV